MNPLSPAYAWLPVFQEGEPLRRFSVELQASMEMVLERSETTRRTAVVQAIVRDRWREVGRDCEFILSVVQLPLFCYRMLLETQLHGLGARWTWM